MEVILLEKINNLGGIGDKVRVRPGYARNFLLPQGKAQPATAENVAAFEARRAELEARAAEELAAAQRRAAALEGVEIRVQAKVGGEGKLFGSVGPGDIVDAAAAMGHEIERAEVRMGDGPIRSAGGHEVTLHLHSGVGVGVRVSVTGGE